MPVRILPPRQPRSSSLWSGTRGLIDRGAVLPIVSNFRLPRVLGCTAGEIASAWAAEIASPLPEQDNLVLARVAQLQAVRAKYVRDSRFDYHNFIKRYLLGRAQEDQTADAEYVNGLIDDDQKFDDQTFTDIARTLDYPKYAQPMQDPLRLLAELPLPIYLTTSPHKFLEDALDQAGREKHETAIFYWDKVAPEYSLDIRDGPQLSSIGRTPAGLPPVRRRRVSRIHGAERALSIRSFEGDSSTEPALSED